MDVADCYCDQNNPLNYGCAAKFLKFLEDTLYSVNESVEDSLKDTADAMANFEDSLNKHTNYLRKSASSDPLTQIEMESVVSRSLADTEGFRPCKGQPGIQFDDLSQSVKACL